MYELVSDEIRLAIDEQGRLQALENRRTGHDYMGEPGQVPWRMFYRLGHTGWMNEGEALDLAIEPEGQSVTVEQDSNTITLQYDRLVAERPHQGETHVVDVSLTLEVCIDNNTLVWNATVENRQEDIEITEVWVPWLRGLGDLGRGREADILYWPERGGRRIRNPYGSLMALWEKGAQDTLRGEAPWYRLTYPFPASMQWFTLNNGEEGLYVGSHDDTLLTTCLNVMADPGKSLSCSVIKYAFVQPGETWRSQPVVTRLYRGDWHGAARFYRAWADSWMGTPDPPTWLRLAPGWVKPFLKNQQGLIRADYDDFPAMLERSQAVGMNVLHCFGWSAYGFDNRYPLYETDEMLGGEEGLRQALDEVEAQGGKMILYTQGQLIDPTTPFYDETGRHVTAKDVWGYEYREQYAFYSKGSLLQTMRNKWFGVACPSAPQWIGQLEAQFHMVRDFGAQGILYDQMGGIPPYICFSDEHDHEKPSLAVGPGKVANMRRLRELIKGEDPDFAFVIELVTDCYCPYVDIIHSHGIGFWPEPEAFGEMFRYTFPEPIITNRADTPRDRQMHFGFAFTMGYRFDASTADTEDEEVAAYLGRLCEIRNTFPDLLLEGRFVDNEGFVCSNNAVAAHGFRQGDDLAVALWNPTDLPQLCHVVAPGYVCHEVVWQDPTWIGPEHLLPPGEVAVLVFGRG